MKILVVSHNVFSKDGNMGKTLSSYFSAFKPENIAQFYIHCEVPTTDICQNYYRITDKEAIKSIITRKSGRIFDQKDIQSNRITSRIDQGNDAKIYQKSRRRTPFIYFVRNLWWSLGCWNTKKYKEWVDKLDPDVVFLASGDYSFIYKIALKTAKQRKIPLVVSCMDDYYFNNKNRDKFGGKFVHRLFMNQVRKTISYCSCIFSICEKMAEDYERLFNKKSYVLHTPASFGKPLEGERENRISYLGNLGYKRNEQLLKLGIAIRDCNIENAPRTIDIYSAESREEILKDFTLQNGISFHRAVSADEVKSIMAKSKYLIHTESFDNDSRKAVRYSVSTKISDSLMSGSLIVAYGPKEIASIKYLKDNGASFVITEDDDLKEKLIELFSNEEKVSETIKRAVELALKNHNSDKNSQFVKVTLKEITNENTAGKLCLQYREYR